MKSLFILFTGLSFTLTASTQNLNSQDSMEILSVIRDWDQAWQIKDHVLATRGYCHDARFTNAFGDKRNGQTEIQDLLKEVFSLPFVMSGNSETTEHRYQVLNDANIMVHTSVIRKGQKMPDGSVMPDRQTTHLRVFQKNGDKWEIKGHLISDARDKQSVKH
jgi:uncharacterized protein (TIGR02246 family)